MDDDGRNWLIGGSPVRAIELNSAVTALVPGATQQNTGLSTLHARPDPVTGVTPTSGLNEGVHVEKINGLYYIFAITWPSGKGRTVTVHRSVNLFGGPWESKVIAQNGFQYNSAGVPISNGTGNDGVAQGSIIQDPDGNWWDYAFRDSGPVGRAPWLVPVTWTDGWPYFGQDQDGKGTYTNLKIGGEKPVQGMQLKSVVSSDEFYNNAKNRTTRIHPNPPK